MAITVLKSTPLLLALAALAAWQPLTARDDSPQDKPAQEAAPPNIHQMWAVTPKWDAGPAFDEAIRAHLAWRKENQDPWQWEMFVAGTGRIDGTVFLRSNGHTHADMDAYGSSEFSAKAMEHWQDNVHPHVAAYESQLSRSDLELSYWPEGDYGIYSVTSFPAQDRPWPRLPRLAGGDQRQAEGCGFRVHPCLGLGRHRRGNCRRSAWSSRARTGRASTPRRTP